MKGRLSEAHSISLGFLKNRGLTESTVSYAMRSILTEVCETRIWLSVTSVESRSFQAFTHRSTESSFCTETLDTQILLLTDAFHTVAFTHLSCVAQKSLCWTDTSSRSLTIQLRQKRWRSQCAEKKNHDRRGPPNPRDQQPSGEGGYSQKTPSPEKMHRVPQGSSH